MRHYFTLLGHELRMLLFAPSTYIAAVLFLAVMGFIFTGLLEAYSKAPQEFSPATGFFQLFWLPVFFMVPLLTMKTISEERRLGTLETLLTTPVSTGEVVLGKYSAAYLLYLLLWGSTGGFFYLLYRFSHDGRFIDVGPLLGGYLFVAVTGLLFIAIGIFASAVTRSQAVAGILCFSLLFLFILGLRLIEGFVNLDALFRPDLLLPLQTALGYARIFDHLEDFSHGVIDTRQVFFYLSGTTLMLILSILGVEVKILQN